MEHLRSVQTIIWFTALALFLWMSARKPGDRRLHLVTILVACWAVGHPFGEAAAAGKAFLGIDPLVCQFVQHALLHLGVYAVLCFFVMTAVPDAAWRIAWRQAVPPVAGVVVMAVAVLSTPAHLRVAAALVPSSSGGGPTGVASISLFYGTANGYLVYAFVVMIVWARRCLRGARSGVHRGMVAVVAGLVLLSMAESVFVLSNVMRYFGSPAPRPVLVAAVFVLMAGIISFAFGFMAPVLVLKAAGLRVWLAHLRVYHQLGPLWTLLHTSFPQSALDRVPVSTWWKVMSVRHVHRRYYRRVIECRDGLVRVGPYAAQLEDSLPLAERLHAALRLVAAAPGVLMAPVGFAVPVGEGLDADVEELVALSRAL